MPRVALHTLGCKLNYAETATIGKQFLDRGYQIVPFGEPADICVINTCSVTERADRECRQIIRRAQRSAGTPFVVVTGCYAQLEPEEVASINGVNLVLGAKEKFDIFRYAGNFSGVRTTRVHVSAIEEADDFGPAFTTDAGSRTRAYLKVQDGCDFNCSFCTIPLARGVSRSQPVEECLSQARRLVAAGYREIVLTGVNVGDYGTRSGSSLVELLRAIEAVRGIDRIRISSIEPNLLTDEILDLVASSRRLCKHFHVPLQSGSDAVLRAMRRRYTTGQYRDRIDAIRRRMPEAGIGVDVITGFPGETEAQYSQTYEFLKELPVSYLHVFTYSERPNTPASTLGDPVEPKVRYRRNEMLRILGQKKKQAFYESMIGKSAEILTEGVVEDSERYGFTDNYVRVAVPGDACEENALRRVAITGVRDLVCTALLTDGGRE